MAGAQFITTAVSPITKLAVLEDPSSVLEKLPSFDDEPINVDDIFTKVDSTGADETFEGLGLSPEILKGLNAENKVIKRPTQLQSMCLKKILDPSHKNLMAQAPNGFGKTTCAALAMLGRINDMPKLPAAAAAPQAIWICPTKEAAIQNRGLLLKTGMYTGITSELAITDKDNYIPLSKRAPVTAQAITGTAGTINKWIAAKKLDTSSLKVLVFDDAEHMLAECGLKEDSVRIMKDIFKQPNTKCQVLLFYATFSDPVNAFASKIMKDFSVQGCNQLAVMEEEGYLDCVKQYKIKVPDDEDAKIVVVKYFIMDFGDKIGQKIIFVKTRRSAGKLHEALVKFGYKVTIIHSALTQEDRDKIVKEFKDGLTHVLISTDVLARGFDESQVNLVINYDLPVVYDDPTEPDNEIYLYRVGIAGRFGRKGAIFNLLCGDEDNKIMEKIENHITNHYVIEMTSWKSEEDYKDALKKAGLM